MAQGADGVELDAMLCGSGEVVVCHDEMLDRLAGVPVRVQRTPYAELREIDVGRHKGEAFRGERIPLFTEVLDALPDGFVVNVELKCETALDGGLARRVTEALAADRGRHVAIVSSFNPLELWRTRRLAPAVPTGLLFEPEQSWWLRRGALAALLASASVHPRHDLCTAPAVERWRRRGFAVATWTVDDPAEIARVAAAGVDAIITNRPRATRALLEAAGRGGVAVRAGKA